MHALRPDLRSDSISCVGFLAGVTPGASPESSTFHSDHAGCGGDQQVVERFRVELSAVPPPRTRAPGLFCRSASYSHGAHVRTALRLFCRCRAKHVTTPVLTAHLLQRRAAFRLQARFVQVLPGGDDEHIRAVPVPRDVPQVAGTRKPNRVCLRAVAVDACDVLVRAHREHSNVRGVPVERGDGVFLRRRDGAQRVIVVVVHVQSQRAGVREAVAARDYRLRVRLAREGSGRGGCGYSRRSRVSEGWSGDEPTVV